MQVNQYPNQATEMTVLDRFGFDQQDTITGDWLTKKYDIPTFVDSMVVLFPQLAENIYTSDGALATGITRTFDLDTGNLKILNGKLYLNTTGFTGGLFQSELFSLGNGMVISAQGVGMSISANNGTCLSMASNNFGFNITAPANVIQASGTTVTAEPSSVLDVKSTTQGSRPSPLITEVQRDAITAPSDYLEITNTTRERKEIFKPFWGWHPTGSITPDWGYEFFDENLNSTINSFFSLEGINGGLVSALTNITLSPTGIIGLSTGVNANGEFRHATKGNYLNGSMGKKQFKNKVCVSALSTVTDRYVSLAGYFRTSTGLAATNGMYFLYDEGGVFDTATASPNWLCICRNGGAYTIVNSGIAVTTTSSSMQTLEILDDGTGANVIFKINGATVATISTNVPNNSITFFAGERIAKTTGTTPLIFYTDFTYVKEKFNTPR